MSTSAENITFMVTRSIVALAIVGLGFYCVAQGIHFWILPRAEAEQIRIHFFGLDISASGLGAVIFGVGVALAYVGKLTAPQRIETTRNTEFSPQSRSTPPSQLPQAAAVVDQGTPSAGGTPSTSGASVA